jgi:hypothetical protein
MTMQAAFLLIRHFLSSLSWVEHAAIREVGALAGSGPFHLGKAHSGSVVTARFRQDYVPDPQDPKTRLALALYREAKSLESIPYKYLGFFKIINILYPNGAAQKAWVNAHLPLLRSASAVERIRELAAQVPDSGAYMYESGRCAVAHAHGDPLIDPDDMEDSRRLSRDLPVLEELVQNLIENEMGVKSSATVWREHLYHLEGFRALLGAHLLDRLKRREAVPVSDMPTFPLLTVAVRDKPLLPSFTALAPTVVDVENGTVWLSCHSPDGALQVILGLAVAEEHLLFDPQAHVVIRLTRDIAALSAEMDHVTLFRDLVLNGQLIILDALTGHSLGRTDAYIGRNIDLTATLKNCDTLLARLAEEIGSISNTGA